MLRRTCLCLPLFVAGLGARPARAGDELVVYAAASLKESFESLAGAFEEAHPGVQVRLAFAGSQEHQTQLRHGAPADVWAAAGRAPAAALEQEKLVAPPRTFARNEPVIVVPRSNPAGLRAFTDLPKTKRLVIGVPEVPIGAYTAQIFDKAAARYGAAFRTRLDDAVVSRELNVRQVLAKVSLGEADAGIVYRTDARAARDKVAIVAIPPALNVIGEYVITTVASSKHQALARAFIELALSPDGQRRLSAAGFLPAAP